MKTPRIVLLSALPLLASCAATSTPSGSPEQIAARIVMALDDGRTDAAHDLFDGAAGREGYRQQLYPLLYEAAQDRYARGDAPSASTFLTFMSDQYPSAEAVQRALLYSLFLERGQQNAPSPDLLARMEDALRAVRSQTRPPMWVDLVETQWLIDQGRTSEALGAYERFAGSWDGEPEAIAIYVDDIERYLASH